MMDSDKQNKRLFERFGREYSGGEIIFSEDETAGEVFMVVEGRIRLTKKVRLVERDIVVLKAGDIFGEAALLPDSTHPCSAVSLGQSQVLAFQADDFEKLLKEQANVALKLIRQLVRRLQSAEERIENMMLGDDQSKIVNTLIRLAQHSPVEDGKTVLHISPIELSSRIGIDIDSVKKGILHFRKNKYVRIVEEKIEILDLEALKKVYNLIGMKEELKKN
jgi:CRP/FNR family cyclic AMP-dependent transcriptional regulator